MIKTYKYLFFCLPRLKFLKKTRGTRYLDFGCGDGHALYQNLAVRPDLNCFCVDIKDFSKSLAEDMIFTVYDGKRLPYKDEIFDIITANHVLEHVNSPHIILSEIKRILKRGGKLFIEVPNQRSLWGQPGGRYAGTIHFLDDATHVHPYSNEDLEIIFQDVGLKIIKIGISRNLLHLFLSPVLLFLGFFKNKKLWYMYGRNSLIGWATFAILEKR